MNRMIYGECVKGASHIRSDTECQDSYKVVELSDDTVVLAVADGHGSTACTYSKSGSVIAVNVFCKVMKDLLESFAADMDTLATYLNREGELKIAQSIDTEWKRRVVKVHSNSKREKILDENGKTDKEAVYRLYGTTLAGLMITPGFIFALQIGDGDIVFVDGEGVTPVIEGDKILGTETHSLSKPDSWKSAISMIRMRDIEENVPYLYMLSTDGFANSFKSQEEFYRTCRDYYDIAQFHGFETIKVNLKNWLNETSEFGCGDDITVVIVRFEK